MKPAILDIRCPLVPCGRPPWRLGLGFGDRRLNWDRWLHIPSHWTPPAWWGTRVISICPTAQMRKLRPTVTQHSIL